MQSCTKSTGKFCNTLHYDHIYWARHMFVCFATITTMIWRDRRNIVLDHTSATHTPTLSGNLRSFLWFIYENVSKTILPLVSVQSYAYLVAQAQWKCVAFVVTKALQNSYQKKSVWPLQEYILFKSWQAPNGWMDGHLLHDFLFHIQIWA